MKKVTMNIDGKLTKAMRFANFKTAQKFIAKKEGREILFSRAGEYYIAI